MDAATEATLSDPQKVVQILEQELARVEDPGESSQHDPVPMVSPVETLRGADISGEDPGVPSEAVVDAISQEKKKMADRREGKKPLDPKAPRYKPTVKLPHKASYVKGWMEQQEHTIDLTGADTSVPMAGEELSDRESEGETQEPLLSEAESIHSEMRLMKQWFEDQMRSTHEILSKVQHRLSVIEQKVAVSVPTHRSSTKDITPASTSKSAASSALAKAKTTPPGTPTPVKPTIDWKPILARNPYRPILVSQRRLLIKLGSEVGAVPKELSTPIPRTEWTESAIGKYFN